jgi:hypothetical protein
MRQELLLIMFASEVALLVVDFTDAFFFYVGAIDGFGIVVGYASRFAGSGN